MSNYSNTFGGAAHDTAEDVIQGADFDTQFDAIATMSATKANKKVPATTNNIAVLDANGDLADSLETVATMKSYAKRGAIYLDAATTSSTIDFSGTTISRASGTIDLSVFKKGDVITITGTTLNNTSYTLASDASASSMTTTATTVTESGEIPVFTTEGVVEVLDEDDMASDSATAVPSQQSAKAYVDNYSTNPRPQVASNVSFSSGTTAELVSTFPAGTSCIEVVLEGVTVSATDHLILQLKENGGSYVTSGYLSRTVNYSYNTDKTNGLSCSDNVGTTDIQQGCFTLRHTTGNVWVLTGTGMDNSKTVSDSCGYVTLAAAVDGIRLAVAGGVNTFTAGNARVTYY